MRDKEINIVTGNHCNLAERVNKVLAKNVGWKVVHPIDYTNSCATLERLVPVPIVLKTRHVGIRKSQSSVIEAWLCSSCYKETSVSPNEYLGCANSICENNVLYIVAQEAANLAEE